MKIRVKIGIDKFPRSLKWVKFHLLWILSILLLKHTSRSLSSRSLSPKRAKQFCKWQIKA
jgi:hypothetical protein